MKKNITTGGPSLFDATPEGEQFDRIYNRIQEQRPTFEGAGKYSPYIPDVLKQRAKIAFCITGPQFRAVLTSNNVKGSTIDAVITDYAALLCGSFNFTATYEQMLEATDATTPRQAFLIDRYGLWFGLLLQYIRCITTYNTYNEQVRAKTATDETRKQFLNCVNTQLKAAAANWLFDYGVISLEDWQNDIAYFGFWIWETRAAAAIGEYRLFYLIAKYSYAATPQELAEINRPSGTDDTFIEAAESEAGKRQRLILAQAKEFKTDNFTSTPDEPAENEPFPGDDPITQSREELARIKKAAAEWEQNNATQTPYSIPPNLLALQSRDIFVSPHGSKIKDILPIQRYIDDWLKDNQYYTNYTVKGEDGKPVIQQKQCKPTQNTIKRVIMGINNLHRLHPVQAVNGYYTYKTSLSELAFCCGYTDANDEIKKQLFQALQILDWSAWLVIWRAKGPSAVRVLTVTEKELRAGGITINVTDDARRGKPILVTAAGWNALQKQIKGEAKRQFSSQILLKTNIRESELINQVFGYDYTLAKLKDNPEEIKKYKDLFRRNKPHYKKQIKTWFEEYKNDGLLKDYSTHTTNGELIYNWIKGELLRGKPLTDDDTTPDEQ